MELPAPTKIQWQRRPRPEDMEHRWEIFRAHATRKTRLLLLSHDLEGCPTHYWEGRTQPCSGEQCPACASNREPQWKGYCCAEIEGSGLKVILEVTQTQAGPLDAQFCLGGTLRGTIIDISRPSGTENGRVRLVVIGQNKNHKLLSTAPSLKPMLERMWRLKRGSVTMDTPNKASPLTLHNETENSVAESA